jgi:uncharacterized phiE125 gp8 family phage protein
VGLTLVTPPTVWPVTLDEARAHLRVRHTDENNYITALIKAATRYVEQTLSTSIAEQTWKLTLDSFSDYIELPRGPVASVDSVEYVDADGETQTADDADYTVDLAGNRQWIVRNSEASWPDTLSGINAVSVTYTAGMNPAPDDLKHAILLLIGHWYAVRETVNVGNITTEMPFAVDALLQTYRTVMV